MMGIVMAKTCWAYKKYNKNKWHLVGFLFFSDHNDARSNKHQRGISYENFLYIRYLLRCSKESFISGRDVLLLRIFNIENMNMNNFSHWMSENM